MNHLIAKADLSDRIICDSAGTAGYHTGSAPDRRMAIAAQKQGITLCGSARQFVRSDFETFDRILAMDQENLANLHALDPTGKHRHQVQLMCDFCTRHTLREVPDPYYGGVEGFNHVIDLLFDACEGLLADVTSELAIGQ